MMMSLRVVGQRPRHADDLLPGGGEAADLGGGRDLGVAEPLEEPGGRLGRGAALGEAEARLLVAEVDVLGDGEALDEVELLVDRRDARGPSRPAGGEAHLLALPGDGALVGLVDAGEDLDEGRLAGAVLARAGSAPRRDGRRGPPRRARPLPGNASRCQPCPRGSRRRCLPWDADARPTFVGASSKSGDQFLSDLDGLGHKEVCVCFTTHVTSTVGSFAAPSGSSGAGRAAPAHARRHPTHPRRAASR